MLKHEEDELFKEVWDEYKDGTLIISIYIKEKWGFQEARNFLNDKLPKALSKYAKIKPLDTAYLMWFPPYKRKGAKGKPTGVLVKYTIDNATPEFYKELFGILNEKKEKTKWLSTYQVHIAHSIIDYESFMEHIELKVDILKTTIKNAVESAISEKERKEIEKLFNKSVEEQKRRREEIKKLLNTKKPTTKNKG